MPLLLAACNVEHDVDVYVALPSVEARASIHAELETTCSFVGIAAVELSVWGPGPESFTIRSERCRHDAELQAVGFLHSAAEPLRFERLLGDYYRVRAHLIGTDGAVRGERELPFHAAESPHLIIGFLREDIPGWPVVTARVSVPACDADPELAKVRVVATPELALQPSAEIDLDCASGSAVLALPRGPVSITGEGRVGGDPCYAGTIDAVVDEDADLELALERLCP